jgi:hypothetical protein
VSHPDELPDLFLDRSLGRIKVPALLRAEGHYGIPADERVPDTEWLELCGTRRWLALMKDDRIRYLPVERRALIEHGVRAAVITNANISAYEVALFRRTGFKRSTWTRDPQRWHRTGGSCGFVARDRRAAEAARRMARLLRRRQHGCAWSLRRSIAGLDGRRTTPSRLDHPRVDGAE